ncbi:uncharacterized protein LOC116416522 [Nasonia vitripennis]|uniref:Transposase n=1 Tax=Nasonia vitripennis TaxID=7425 RepID=A0A7M7Q3T8_NASVI|nr:uncharacterized protein LOC116416522 [Nasonia vitripennis]
MLTATSPNPNENDSLNNYPKQEDETHDGTGPKSIKLSQKIEEKLPGSIKSTNSKQFKVNTLFENQQSFNDGDKANGMLNRIFFMIAKDQMPYSCVEKIGLRTLLNYAAPHYKIPCRTTIAQKMEAKYACISNIVKEDLSKVKYITLTADAWSDTLNNVGYLGVTCLFIHNYGLQSINIGVTELNDYHTSENLKNWLL